MLQLPPAYICMSKCDPVAAEQLRPAGGRDLAPAGVGSVVMSQGHEAPG